MHGTVMISARLPQLVELLAAVGHVVGQRLCLAHVAALPRNLQVDCRRRLLIRSRAGMWGRLHEAARIGFTLQA